MADRHDLHFAHRRAVAHVVESDLRFTQEFGQRRPAGGEAGEDETAITVHARRVLHAAIRVVARHAGALVALGQRNRTHAPIQMKTPRVVRADEGAARVAAQIAHQLCAAMRATVVQHLHAAVTLAHHDHRLPPDGHGVIVTRFRYLRYVPAVDPCSFPDLLHLGIEDGLVGVNAPVDAIGFHERQYVHVVSIHPAVRCAHSRPESASSCDAMRPLPVNRTQKPAPILVAHP